MKTFAHFQRNHNFITRQGYITDTLEEAIKAVKDDKADDEYVYILDSKELYLLACITIDGEILYPVDIKMSSKLSEIQIEKQTKNLVHCKDCTRFIPQGTQHFDDGTTNKDTCEVIRGFVVQIDPNGFCAWGKRRGDA